MSAVVERTRWERPVTSASRLRGRPHCAGPRGRRLGPLAWAFAVSLQELRAHLQCADQDATGASAQEGKMVWHAQMIEGKSLAKTAALCGVHPTTPGSPPGRHRSSSRAGCHQAAKLKGDCRSGRDRTRPRILQGPMVRSAAPCAQTRRQGQASGARSGQYSRSRRPRPEGLATNDAVLPQVDGAS